jgi:hypothetical protein
MDLSSHTKKTTTTRASVVSLLTVAVLVIASLASIGMMMQTNNAAAAGGNTIFKEKFRESSAFAEKKIEEGSITTQAGASAFNPKAGGPQICVFMTKYDSSTDTDLVDFFGCGPVSQLTIANGLNSATFSGTITGTDYATGEEKTVTVNVDLTATGKVQTAGTFGLHYRTPDFTLVEHLNGQFRPASGSLNISGDLTFSTDDATGSIDKLTSGVIDVEKV